MCFICLLFLHWKIFSRVQVFESEPRLHSSALSPASAGADWTPQTDEGGGRLVLKTVIYLCLCVCATQLSASDLSTMWAAEGRRKHSQRSHFLPQICAPQINTHSSTYTKLSLLLFSLHFYLFSLPPSFFLFSFSISHLIHSLPPSPFPSSLQGLVLRSQHSFLCCEILNIKFDPSTSVLCPLVLVLETNLSELFFF